jgi:hypothetical protein
MATFMQLRAAVIAKAKVRDMFAFRLISPAHNAFWDEMNEVEYRRGYVAGEYEKPNTPALCEMDLLTIAEFEEWVRKFKALSRT